MRGRHRFSIPFLRYLDYQGKPDNPLPAWTEQADLLHSIYENMVLARILDEKAIALQRTGQLGTYPSTLGQEAIGVCIGLAMSTEDVLVPYYRDAPAQMIRGMKAEEILLYWGGDERGGNLNTSSQDLPPCVPIATQLSQAVGVAAAMKIKNEPRVTVATCGDGATSKGDFMEALNVAGVWKLPIVFVINNNQWAISVPIERQTATTTLAQKAIAAGIDGIEVDGNDPIAVYEAVSRAIAQARKNSRPMLIEALTYRLSDHTTADDASRYRDPEDVKNQWRQEPIARFRNYLHAHQLWDAQREQALQQRCHQTVETAVENYLGTPAAPAESIIDYLYQFLPVALESQREAIIHKAQSLNKIEQGV